jgi:hypothetical protein
LSAHSPHLLPRSPRMTEIVSSSETPTTLPVKVSLAKTILTRAVWESAACQANRNRKIARKKNSLRKCFFMVPQLVWPPPQCYRYRSNRANPPNYTAYPSKIELFYMWSFRSFWRTPLSMSVNCWRSWGPIEGEQEGESQPFRGWKG